MSTPIVRQLIGEVGNPILEAAKAACQSRTLRDALKAETLDSGLVISVPHYWAQWFEGGRGGVSARPGHKLVFYRNPAEDPRLSGGYPVRLSDVRKLTKGEFYRDLAAGKLVVRDSVGAAPPHSFMGDGLTARAAQLVAEASVRAAQAAVRESMGELFNAKVTTTL